MLLILTGFVVLLPINLHLEWVAVLGHAVPRAAVAFSPVIFN